MSSRSSSRAPWVVAVLTILLLSVATQAEGTWFPEMDEAQAAARREGKDLLIDFGGSDWCAPCQWLKSRILTRPEFVGPTGKLFVLVDIDDLARRPMPAGRKERYQALQQRYGIAAFP